MNKYRAIEIGTFGNNEVTGYYVEVGDKSYLLEEDSSFEEIGDHGYSDSGLLEYHFHEIDKSTLKKID